MPKKQVLKDEEEVFGTEAGTVKEATPAPTPASPASDFPASVSVIRSDWGVPAFQVVADGKGNARIYGKKGEPVSTVLPLSEASMQASRHNAVDPEQLAARSRRARS